MIIVFIRRQGGRWLAHVFMNVCLCIILINLPSEQPSDGVYHGAGGEGGSLCPKHMVLLACRAPGPVSMCYLLRADRTLTLTKEPGWLSHLSV